MTDPTTPAPASGESVAAFVERMDQEDLSLECRRESGRVVENRQLDLERLIAIARRSAASAPAGDAVERVARELIRWRAPLLASDEYWPKLVSDYRGLCADFPAYENARALINDAFRDTRAALAAIPERGRLPIADEELDAIEAALNASTWNPVVPGATAIALIARVRKAEAAIAAAETRVLMRAAEIADQRVAIDKRLAEAGEVPKADALLCILTGEGIAKAIRAAASQPVEAYLPDVDDTGRCRLCGFPPDQCEKPDCPSQPVEAEHDVRKFPCPTCGHHIVTSTAELPAETGREGRSSYTPVIIDFPKAGISEVVLADTLIVWDAVDRHGIEIGWSADRKTRLGVRWPLVPQSRDGDAL